MFKPELLSPAGTLKNMRYAFAYGADAVYAGQPRYSLRVRNNEFNHENLQLASAPKNRIAQAAVKMIHEGMTVILDSGSTTMLIAEGLMTPTVSD